MKKNINLLLASILVITLMSVFSISLVSAEIPTASNITVNLPTASSRVSGASVIFNISFDAGFEDQNWSKLSTLYLISSNTANISVAKGTIAPSVTSNDTATDFNGTFSSSVVEDGTGYTLTFALTNGTSNLNKTVSITVDNGIPTTPTLSPTTETKDTDGTVNFTGTLEGENTTSCTLYFDGRNPGSTSYTMDHVGDTCSYTLSNIPEQTYKWYIENSDGTNTTNSATNTVHIDTSNKNTGIITTEVDEQGFALEGDEDVSNWIIPIIVILVVLGVGYFIAKRK